MYETLLKKYNMPSFTKERDANGDSIYYGSTNVKQHCKIYFNIYLNFRFYFK